MRWTLREAVAVAVDVRLRPPGVRQRLARGAPQRRFGRCGETLRVVTTSPQRAEQLLETATRLYDLDPAAAPTSGGPSCRH